MTIPTLYELYVPILELLADGAPHTRREIVDNLSDRFGLSDVERNPMTGGSGQSSMYSRTSVALTGLKDAGLIASAQWGAYRITELGQSVRSDGQERVERVVKARRPREAGVKQQRVPARHIQYDLDGSPETQRNSQPNREQPSRVAVFEEILREAEGPLHYSDIHRKAVERIGEEHPKRITYASMYASNRFRLIGKGLFDLPERDDEPSNGDIGNASLWRCPTPLLPVVADSRGYFESIIVGRNLLSANEGMTAEQFYVQMCRWADRPMGSRDEIQSAFDAWYVAGLLPRIDYAAQKNTVLESIIPPEATLSEARIACIRTLFERLSYVPELMTAIFRLPRPTVVDVQRVLQVGGDARAGISQRLDMLVSLGAVRSEGNAWILTGIGKRVLDAHSPVHLGLDGLQSDGSSRNPSDKLDENAELGIIFEMGDAKPHIDVGAAEMASAEAHTVLPDGRALVEGGESEQAAIVEPHLDSATDVQIEPQASETYPANRPSVPELTVELRAHMLDSLQESIRILFPLRYDLTGLIIEHNWHDRTVLGVAGDRVVSWRGYSARLGIIDPTYHTLYVDFVRNLLSPQDRYLYYGREFVDAVQDMSAFVTFFVTGFRERDRTLIRSAGYLPRSLGRASIHACMAVPSEEFWQCTETHWAACMVKLLRFQRALAIATSADYESQRGWKAFLQRMRLS